jgi:hypothetical protein
MRVRLLRCLLVAPLVFGACVEDDSPQGEDLAQESEGSLIDVLALLEPGSWGNIPVFNPSIEVHTCDLDNADTDDDVQIHIQVGSGVKDYWIDQPENDFERNRTTSFAVPAIGPPTMQLKDIKLISVRKTGSNGWCFDRLTLKSAGRTVWEYAATDPTAAGTALRPNIGSGVVWLDNDDTHSPDVTFTDTTIHYNNRANHGPLDIEITTCADKPYTDPPFSPKVRVRWTHDGFVETTPELVVDNPIFGGPGPPIGHGNYRPYGSVEHQHLADDVSIEKLQSLRIDIQGYWCVSQVRLFANGHELPILSSRLSIPGVYEDGKWKWSGPDLLADRDITIETGTHVGRLGRPIARSGFAARNLVEWDLSPNTVRPYCSIPTETPRSYLVGLVQTGFANIAHGKAHWGSDGKVELNRVDSDTVHVAMNFAADAKIGRDARLTVDYDLTVDCGPDPDHPEDPQQYLQLVPSHFERTEDLALVTRIAIWFKETLTAWDFSKYMDKQFPKLPRQLFPIPGDCPRRHFDAQADLHIEWPEIPLVNALCLMDSSKWDDLGTALAAP